MSSNSDSDLGSQTRPISLSPSPPPGPTRFNPTAIAKMGNAPSSAANGNGGAAIPRIPETKPMIAPSIKNKSPSLANPRSKPKLKTRLAAPTSSKSAAPEISDFEIYRPLRPQKKTAAATTESDKVLTTLARNPFRINGEEGQQGDQAQRSSPGPQRSVPSLSSPNLPSLARPASFPIPVAPVAVVVSTAPHPPVPVPVARPTPVENPLALNEQLISIYKSLNPKQKEINLAALIALTDSIRVRKDAMRVLNPLEGRMEVDSVPGASQISPTKSKSKSTQELIEEKLAILQAAREERIRNNTLKRHGSKKQEIEIWKVANVHKVQVITTTTISYFVEWENGTSEWVTADDFASPNEARAVFEKYAPKAVGRRGSGGSIMSESPMAKGAGAQEAHGVKKPRGRPRKSRLHEDDSVGGKPDRSWEFSQVY